MDDNKLAFFAYEANLTGLRLRWFDTQVAVMCGNDVICIMSFHEFFNQQALDTDQNI
jgi:hypothetical protein